MHAAGQESNFTNNSTLSHFRPKAQADSSSEPRTPLTPLRCVRGSEAAGLQSTSPPTLRIMTTKDSETTSDNNHRACHERGQPASFGDDLAFVRGGRARAVVSASVRQTGGRGSAGAGPMPRRIMAERPDRASGRRSRKGACHLPDARRSARPSRSRGACSVCAPANRFPPPTAAPLSAGRCKAT